MSCRAQGIDYLYLSQADYERLSKSNSIRAVPHPSGEASGEVHYRLVGIIGQRDGIGVENLHGSALVAGETSRAYAEVPTYSLVTGRTVGIGSYLVRLGRRVVQVDNSHIILTGECAFVHRVLESVVLLFDSRWHLTLYVKTCVYSQNIPRILMLGAAALNRVLGRNVYASNDQIGGTGIMYGNGITHSVVPYDLDGVIRILLWISHTPPVRTLVFIQFILLVYSNSIQ